MSVPVVRCAIYARFSSDLQRPTSIDDQIRRCREFAAHQGWTVLEDFVRVDEAKSAATLAGRDSLNSLLAEVKQKPVPFDCLLVDDTSRLARNLADVLNLNDRLRYQGAFIYAVAQRLDCREKTSRPLLTLHGMMDEQFLQGLAEKVHRGQEGRALAGMQPGGKCFGYRNVPVADPTRGGKYGRSAIIGVRLEIEEEQAQTVRRVFEMYAKGNSLSTIAKQLNSEGVLAPQPPRTRPAPERSEPGALQRFERCCAMNAIAVSASGTERARNAIPKLDARRAARVLSPIGFEWMSLSGASCPTSSGSRPTRKSDS